MGGYDDLKNAVSAIIKTNGNQEITGATLQSTLISIINTISQGAIFKGVASFSTNPGSPDANVFYLAGRPGYYPNFNLELAKGLHIIENKSGLWVNTEIALDVVDAVNIGGAKHVKPSQAMILALQSVEQMPDSEGRNNAMWWSTDGNLKYRQNDTVYNLDAPAYVLYYCGDKIYRWTGSGFSKMNGSDGAEYEVGTYAQAWAKSQSDNKIWPWLLVDTVSGATIRKPIWHIGNSVFIDAAGATISIDTSAPSAPTFSQAGGSVSVNTQIVITPAIGSVLYYKVNNGSTQTSTGAVTIAINQASMVIEAWCVNAGGSSTHVTNTYTADAPAAPTMSPNAGTITRGTVVTITATDGTLRYKVNNGATQTASGLTATVTCTSNTTTIEAWVEQSGMSSTHVTNTYSVPVPNTPTLSIESGTEVTSGTTLNVTFSGGTLHYKVNNGATQTKSASPLTLALTNDTNIEAWVVDANNESSEHVTGSYTIAVDHKFVFKIKLSGDNSTEYVPVTHQPVPGFSSNAYTMSVDWGDGTVDNFTNKTFSQKECSHAYTGAAGDEKTITLRGSAIPALYFAESATGAGANSYGNVDALVAILENTLTCDTYITINGGCSSLSADALSNNVGTGHLHLQGLTSFPTGLLNHLSKTGITDFNHMFTNGVATFTAENMQELRTSLSSATELSAMFYGFNGVCALPNNLFDLMGTGVVTSVWALTHTAKSGLTGDAKALYDVLSTKVTSSANTTYCFSAASLTNRNQVPNAWGGTAG